MSYSPTIFSSQNSVAALVRCCNAHSPRRWFYDTIGRGRVTSAAITPFYTTTMRFACIIAARQLNERMQDGPSRGQRRPRHEVTCLATSPDGIHWEKPNLGLISFEGTTANNIILTGDGAHNFFPFRDENPNADPKQRYKAFGTMKSPGRGLLPFTSADGIRWGRASDNPVITDGKFDSQNVAFWDQQIGAYRAYYRAPKTAFGRLKWRRPQISSNGSRASG